MTAGGFDLLYDPGCVNFALEIIDDDFGTALGEARSYRRSDPPRAARHQRNPFCQSLVRHRSLHSAVEHSIGLRQVIVDAARRLVAPCQCQSAKILPLILTALFRQKSLGGTCPPANLRPLLVAEPAESILSERWSTRCARHSCPHSRLRLCALRDFAKANLAAGRLDAVISNHARSVTILSSRPHRSDGF